MKIICFLSAFLMIAVSNPAHAEPLWSAGPFDMPESVLFDRQNKRVIVSVIGGNPVEADGNGTLVLLSTDGEILDPNWTTGLDAPKGMALLGSTLLVADLTRLHAINAATGEVLRTLEAPGSIFLNDVTVINGQAFISDFMAGSIWRYDGQSLSPWLSDPLLGHPNGLLADKGRLLVGTWGTGLREDFSTEVPGSLLSIDLASKEISVLVKTIGNLDGLARVNDELVVSDWVSGQLFQIIPLEQQANPIGAFPAGLADISADRGTLFLPSMLEGTVSAYSFSALTR